MISVLMVVYNEQKYIQKAMRSVLSQSFSDFELVVVDDGSTDNTLNIARRIANGDHRVRVISAEHAGKNHAINIGLQQLKGEWVAFLAGDDFFDREALSMYWKYACSFNGSADRVAIPARLRMFSNDEQYRKLNGLELPKNKNAVMHSGGVCMRSMALMEDLFPFPENRPNEDTWVSLYFQHMHPILVPCPHVTLNYRIHSGNSIKKDEEWEVFREKYYAREGVAKDFLERFANRLSAEDEADVSRRYKLAELVYRGETAKILLMPGISFKNRMRALCYSNECLYRIKVRLNAVLFGH